MPPPAPQRSQELEESYRIWGGRIQALQKDRDWEFDGEQRFVLAERVAEAVRYRDEIARHLVAYDEAGALLDVLDHEITKSREGTKHEARTSRSTRNRKKWVIH